MVAPISVLVVEDSLIIRAMLRELLDAHPDLTVIDAVESAEEALDLIPLLRPDVIALDEQLPGISGTQMLSVLRAAGVEARVVMISAQARLNSDFCERAFEFGALACFNKARLTSESADLARVLSLAAYGRIPPTGHQGLGTILPRARVDFI